MARLFPNWIDAYLGYATHSEAPEKFHFWTAISTIAGAVRRQCWIEQGFFQWVPNFYIIFVAPPGIIAKSTTADIGMRLLRGVPGIKFGPDAITWQSLIMELANSTEAFMIGDDHYPMSAITIVAKELGTFFNPQDRDMVNALVALWDGQVDVFRKSTKTQGSDEIKNPWINIIGCTTPAWISDTFPEYMIGGGFVSRSIFVYGEEKQKLIPYPGDIFGERMQKLQLDLIHDLEYISVNVAGSVTLSPEAHAWGVDWYMKHYNEHKDTIAGERFANSIARKQTHIHKLAMILSIARSDDRIISEADVVLAETHISEAEADLPKVFSRINSLEAKASNALVELIQRRGKVEKAQAYRSLFHAMSLEQFKNAIDAGVASGQLRVLGDGHNVNLIAIDPSTYNGH